jgi:hypothetical protein
LLGVYGVRQNFRKDGCKNSISKNLEKEVLNFVRRPQNQKGPLTNKQKDFPAVYRQLRRRNKDELRKIA